MILTCPSCAARFEIDEAHLGQGGRKVRCGRCSHVWHQAPEPPPVPSDEPERLPPPITKLQEFDEVRRRSAEMEAEAGEAKRSWHRLALPWLAFAGVVVVIVLGLAFGRQQIVEAVPEAAHLYRLVGLEVEQSIPGEGLDLRDVKQVRSLDDDQYTLMIQGTVVNVSEVPREVPGVRVTITDEADQLVDSWTITPEVELLAPGQSTAFQTSIKDPPRNGNLTVDFNKDEP